MADGDAAAEAGMDVVPGTADLRNGYNEVNKTRDYLANHQTSGTHSAEQITSGTLSAARLPAITIDRLSGGGLSFTPTGGTQYTCVGSIGVLGAVAVDGYLVVGGDVTAPDVYSTSVTGTGFYRAMYVNSVGLFGYVPSARRLKKNIKAADAQQLARLLEAPVVEFDYKAEIGGGHDVGLIADDLHELGLGAFVFYEDDGQVAGIHYERLSIALLAIVQLHETRIKALEESKETS